MTFVQRQELRVVYSSIRRVNEDVLPVTVSGAYAEPVGDPTSQHTLPRQLMVARDTPNQQCLPDLSAGATALPHIYPPNQQTMSKRNS